MVSICWTVAAWALEFDAFAPRCPRGAKTVNAPCALEESGNLVLTLREGRTTEAASDRYLQDAKEWAVATQNWEPPQTKLLGCAELAKFICIENVISL